MIQFEYNSVWAHAGATLAHALTFLAAHGFAVYLLKGNRLQRFEYDHWGEFAQLANFVALRPGTWWHERLQEHSR